MQIQFWMEVYYLQTPQHTKKKRFKKRRGEREKKKLKMMVQVEKEEEEATMFRHEHYAEKSE